MPDGTTDEEAAAAERVFGTRVPLARRYAALLRGPGIERGLLGPREGQRLWERHLLNSAVVAELVPAAVRVVDVGSGAGLPGVPLAVARPDLQVTLVEPMRRRRDFLMECVAELGLEGVAVVGARAEELTGRVEAEVVVARAVARLARLLSWTLPLTAAGGQVLAVKGSTVTEELAELGLPAGRGPHSPPAHWVARGAEQIEVREAGCGVIDPPAIVVCVRRLRG